MDIIVSSEEAQIVLDEIAAERVSDSPDVRELQKNWDKLDHWIKHNPDELPKLMQYAQKQGHSHAIKQRLRLVTHIK